MSQGVDKQRQFFDKNSNGFRTADNEIDTNIMMPKAHITKAEISKLTEAIEPIICIRGGGGVVLP